MDKQSLKTFHSFDKDHVFIKWAFLILSVSFIAALAIGYLKMVEAISLESQKVIVIDRNNQTYLGSVELLSLERRRQQLLVHAENYYKLFWNVSQEKDNIDLSVNKALELADTSAVRMYEKYYQIQGMENFLYENSGASYIHIEDVQIDMSSYPYSGYIEAIQEIETPHGNSERRMDATFNLMNYPKGYKNSVGAMLFDIEVYNDSPIEKTDQYE